jgi:putative endonuclease
MEAAIAREKQLKNWHRAWKINLINDANPHWVDLAVGLGMPPIGQESLRDRPWNDSHRR